MAEPGRFTTAAIRLEQAGATGASHAAARTDRINRVGGTTVMIEGGWRSPLGARVASALAAWRTAAKSPGPAVADAYRALGDLAAVARRTGAALEQADRYERNVFGTAIDRVDGIRDRVSLNVRDVIGLVSDDDAHRRRDEMDRLNRLREQAGAQREAALRTWSNALQQAAGVVTAATRALQVAITPVPVDLIALDEHIPPMPPRPPADDAGAPDDYGTKRFPPPLVNLTKANGMVAGAETLGWNNAARHMRHYLENTGTPLDVDPDRMVREIPSYKRSIEERVDADSRAAALRAVADGRLGVPVPFTTDWNDGRFVDEESWDWYYAVHEHKVAVTGVVVVDPADTASVTVQYRIHIADRYNWDTGKPAGGPVGDAKDDDMLSLHQAGLAREFDMQGSSVVHTMAIDTSSPVVPDGGTPDQREHAGSRGDPGRGLTSDDARDLPRGTP